MGGTGRIERRRAGNRGRGAEGATGRGRARGRAAGSNRSGPIAWPSFFIDRPIFAIVIAILIMVAGALSIFTLADRAVSADRTAVRSDRHERIRAPRRPRSRTRVVQVIEQQMSGLDHLLYMSSTSDDTGQSTTTLTFATGTDPDIAQVQVQNKGAAATSNCPQQVQQSGVRRHQVHQLVPDVVGFVSTDTA